MSAASEVRPLGMRASAPLPIEPFETGTWPGTAGGLLQITVRTNRYSVPGRLFGGPVRVLLHASDLVVYDGRAEVARRHERPMAKSGYRLDTGQLPGGAGS